MCVCVCVCGQVCLWGEEFVLLKSGAYGLEHVIDFSLALLEHLCVYACVCVDKCVYGERNSLRRYSYMYSCITVGVFIFVSHRLLWRERA